MNECDSAYHQESSVKPIPIANGEGRYYADTETLRGMHKKNQIVFKYANKVNGSEDQIAGVCNSAGNVVG